ncbi:unnamed protein product [Candida verbasci]|uniref:separase n=1 Tax=Candida verbasci TaxID=1227364 RepID=A0A9W4XGE6_9ASCO|nr:unnamed protein product [Candida verbasci]
MDLIERLQSFIQSNEITALSVNINNINKPQHDLKYIESSCKKSIDTLIKSFDHQQISSINLYFKSLYIIYQNDYGNLLNTIRNHHMLIVNLFESKQINGVIIQLKIIHKQFKRLLEVNSDNVFYGIPFVKSNDDQLNQLVIAFHFFILQAKLLYISKNLKIILSNNDELISLKMVESIPKYFLSTSSIMKWQQLYNNEKYLKNTEKLIQGYIKLFNNIRSNKFERLTNCLRIKLIALTSDTSSIQDMDLTSDIIHFINDSKINLNTVLEAPQSEASSSSTLVNDDNKLQELKALKLNKENARLMTSFFHTSITEMNLSNLQLSILDSLTIYLKDNLDLVPLQKLFDIYAHFKQIKRSRNLSNILFNNQLWELSIEYESRVFHIKPSRQSLNCLLDKFKHCEVNQNILNLVLHACQTMEFNEQISQIVCPKLKVGLIIDNGLKDEFKFSLVTEIFKLSDEPLCNSIIKDISFTDKSLQKQVQYNYYNANINHLNLDFKPDNLLIQAGFQLQKLLINYDNELQNICLTNFATWVTENTEFTEFEYLISRHLLLYFKYSGVDTGSLIDLYSSKPITKEFKVFLQMISGDLTSLSQLMKQANVNLKAVLTFQLLQFEINPSKELYNKIKNILESRSEFDMSSSRNLPVLDKFQNFLILGKFQYLTSKFNTNPIDKYLHLKTSIQILYSIQKKCVNGLPRFETLELKWEITHLMFNCYDSIIQVSIDLGISRDITYYIKEWKSLNEANIIPIINERNNQTIEYYNKLINEPLINQVDETQEIKFYPGLLQGSSTGELEEINNLIDLKDRLLNELYTSPSQKSIHALNHCILKLSSITISKESELTSQLLFLEDYVKYLPFENESTIYKNMKDGDYLPQDPISIESIESKYHNFNIDLNLYLPADYSIVSIDICSITGDLLIMKLIKGTSPFFIRIPIGKDTFKNLKSEFYEIISKSSFLTKKITTSQVVTKDDRKAWWRKRFELDFELKDLFNNVQDWFGDFINLFEVEDDEILFPKFKRELNKIGIYYHDILMKCILSSKENDQLIKLLKVSDKQKRSIKILIDKYQKLRYSKTKSHTILIPSSKCIFFSWESLSIFENKSISRMTSIHQLLNQLKATKLSNFSNVYYLLNPSGDLKNSENRFKDIFQQSNWHGKISEKPTEYEFLNNLQNCDMFIYIGHGGCENYYKPMKMYKAFRNKNLPPSLLIGCSSGSVTNYENLNSYGNFFNWVNNNVPSMLVNLWDVTDKDIDLFTLSMLEKFGLINKNVNEKKNLSQAALESRSKCVMKYLNGSAPVIYGLPISK